MVSVEESGVYLDALCNAAGNAEADHDPVEWRAVMSPRLPAVVPGSGSDIVAGAVDGRRRGEEIGGFGKELVGIGENLRG